MLWIGLVGAFIGVVTAPATYFLIGNIGHGISMGTVPALTDVVMLGGGGFFFGAVIGMVIMKIIPAKWL